MKTMELTSGVLTAMGAIAIYNKRANRPFTDEDRELFELVTANASTALNNRRMMAYKRGAGAGSNDWRLRRL